MAVKVTSAATAAQKFVQRAQAAAPAYQAGVQGAGQSWETATSASAPNWAAGVQDAVANGRFANGVAGSANKYQTNASGIGAQRYGPGVSNAQPAYQAGVAPYLTTISNLTLPPRAPKGNPQNYARVQAIGDALRAQKLSM